MYFEYRRTSTSMDTSFTFLYRQLSCKYLLRLVCIILKKWAILNYVKCKNYVKLPWIEICIFCNSEKKLLSRISSPRFMFFPEGSAKASFFRRLAFIFSIFDSCLSCFKPYFGIRVRYITYAFFTFETSKETGQMPIFGFTLIHRIQGPFGSSWQPYFLPL